MRTREQPPTSVQWAARRSAAFASVQNRLRGTTAVLDMLWGSGQANSDDVEGDARQRA